MARTAQFPELQRKVENAFVTLVAEKPMTGGELQEAVATRGTEFGLTPSECAYIKSSISFDNYTYKAKVKGLIVSQGKGLGYVPANGVVAPPPVPKVLATLLVAASSATVQEVTAPVASVPALPASPVAAKVPVPATPKAPRKILTPYAEPAAVAYTPIFYRPRVKAAFINTAQNLNVMDAIMANRWAREEMVRAAVAGGDHVIQALDTVNAQAWDPNSDPSDICDTYSEILDRLKAYEGKAIEQVHVHCKTALDVFTDPKNTRNGDTLTAIQFVLVKRSAWWLDREARVV
jgi:hypothetical protein